MISFRSRRLFRRRRNGDVAGSENSSPRSGSGPGASIGGTAEAEGGDSESPPPAPPAASDAGPPDPEPRDAGGSDGGDASAAPPAADDLRDDDDEERDLVVQIPTGHPSLSSGLDAPSPFLLPAAAAWEPSEEAVALRRESIRREVERVQRANFAHFAVLCVVPTALLLIVISAILSEDGECGEEAAGGGAYGTTECEREPRSFVNAFTSRCICEAVKVLADDLGGEGGR